MYIARPYINITRLGNEILIVSPLHAREADLIRRFPARTVSRFSTL